MLPDDNMINIRKKYNEYLDVAFDKFTRIEQIIFE
jgi:hypothetical protein